MKENKENLENKLEAVLFVSGDPIEISFLCEKWQLSRKDMDKVIAAVKEKYAGNSGIHLISFREKLQFASNPQYVDDVAEVLNPILEKELTKSMLETVSIIAYKQPLTRLEIEDIRGVDCTYALQTLSKMKLVNIVGRKDAVGKPLLFGTTDEFLKRFSLNSLHDLPDYDELAERIKTIPTETSKSLFDKITDESFNLPDEEIPEFLADEKVDRVE